MPYFRLRKEGGGMGVQLPALLADPAPGTQRIWFTGARLFDGYDTPPRDGAAVLVDAGKIARVGSSGDAVPEGALVIDLAGRTLMPGIVNAHIHAFGDVPQPKSGAEPILDGVRGHFLADRLRESLRMGITTVRDMGTFGDQVLEARQGMRYGAFRGPRLLTCGLIISSTAPGGVIFRGMYREVDGPDEVRKGVREQLRRGADFIKVMADGARTVELEAGIMQEPEGGAPRLALQLTREELAVAVDEASRLGYYVVAHAEGLNGCEAAIELGLRTIEHGFYLHRRPELLERMAERRITLVPTFSSSYMFGGRGWGIGLDGPHEQFVTPELDRGCTRNIIETEKTVRAAVAAGTPIALGADDFQARGGAWLEILRLVHHGLPARSALAAGMSGAAFALGLQDSIGTVEVDKLADLVVIDGDPVERPELLGDPANIWLVLQLGDAVAGTALERGVPDLAATGEPALV
jgi:imidazolonepropionase-like amidohydrolase